MSGSGEASKGESSSSQVQRVDIPDFLQDFIRQGTDTASGALSSLQELLGGDNTAGFSPDQIAAQNAARDVAGGAGGFIPTAQEQTLQTAQGRSLESILGPDAFGALTNFAGGRELDEFIDPTALAALQSQAGGEFLHGGAGFEAALEAASREAQRSAANAFGGSAGGVGSGLSRAAVGEGTADAFAGLFDSNLNRQLDASGILGGFGDSESNRGLSASGILGNVANAERGRQDTAVANLPGVGLLPADILDRIGSQIQRQNQRGIDRPQQDMLQLLQAALSGLPIRDLFGQSGEGEMDFSKFGLGFEAA